MAFPGFVLKKVEYTQNPSWPILRGGSLSGRLPTNQVIAQFTKCKKITLTQRNELVL